MSEIAGTPPNRNGGLKGAVSARTLARLRSQPLDEAAKVLAGVLAEQRPIKPTKQLLSTASGVSIHRISKAQNGSRPRRPKPSPKMAELLSLLQETESVLNSPNWWNDSYRQSELGFLDRRFNDFHAAHPDIEAWPVPCATAFNVAWLLIATTVANTAA
jgi:hypothetical protein